MYGFRKSLIGFFNHYRKIPQSRLLEIEVFRGIAVLCIILHHYFGLYHLLHGHHFSTPDPATLAIIFNWGVYGVHLFFIISGFVIFISLDKNIRPIDFIVGRIARLYPAYWIVVIYTFTIRSLFHFYSLPFTWSDVIINLSMFQQILGFRNIDGPFWYLAYELMFYIFMITLFSLRMLNSVKTLVSGVLIYQLFMLILLQFLGVNVGLTEGFAAGFTVATLHVRQILIISLLPFFHLFMIGILFYRLRLAKDKSFMSHVLIGCCVLMEFIVWGIGATLALCLFVSMFYLFVYNRSSFIINKPLLFLGRISYCLFLIHQATGFIIIKQCYGHKINPFFGIGIAISVSIVLATLLNFFIEEPARAWVKRFYLQNSSSDTA